jgi:hypothetical protein
MIRRSAISKKSTGPRSCQLVEVTELASLDLQRLGLSMNACSGDWFFREVPYPRQDSNLKSKGLAIWPHVSPVLSILESPAPHSGLEPGAHGLTLQYTSHDETRVIANIPLCHRDLIFSVTKAPMRAERRQLPICRGSIRKQSAFR